MARKKKGESEALEVDAEDVGTEPDGEAVEVVEDETGGEGGEDAEAGFPLEFRCVAASGETDAEGWVDYYHFETARKDTMGPDRMMLTIRGRDSATEPAHYKNGDVLLVMWDERLAPDEPAPEAPEAAA